MGRPKKHLAPFLLLLLAFCIFLLLNSPHPNSICTQTLTLNPHSIATTGAISSTPTFSLLSKSRLEFCGLLMGLSGNGGKRSFITEPPMRVFRLNVLPFMELPFGAQGLFQMLLESTSGLFFYRLVGTWGQLLFPKPWKEFRLRYDDHKAKDIKPFLDGMVNLHEKSLSVSHRDVGVNYGKTAGPDSQLLDANSFDSHFPEMKSWRSMKCYGGERFATKGWPKFCIRNDKTDGTEGD
ncbi:hypothetical protein F3Y22_tig00116997pilonHSYRG00200 [Hibiscus syriacus]|uniref:Uncharacterized protein n=1 Tax=Hibiscus syriacus TaxID=106335 RepID=A0A6A2WL81_HIBSY|nr:hypothetical protein F3Y22_tig00116997pilonHSYRG00200 [Hibiscus syriacus]